MQKLDQFMYALALRLVASWKTTLFGVALAIGTDLLGQLSNSPNVWVHTAAVMVAIPFALFKDQHVKDGTAAKIDPPPALLAFFLVFTLALGAHAQTPGARAVQAGTLADVAQSDPTPVPVAPAPVVVVPRFGGCNKVGSLCYGPSISISLISFNLRTKDFVEGLIPGVGYGVTFFADQPYQLGLAGYANVQTSGPGVPSSGMFSGVLSFAEYIRLGIGYQVIGGNGSTFILGGIGIGIK